MVGSVHVPLTSTHRITADGVNVFYREAGPRDAPVVLLLHGFPASSLQYRELIPRLADRFRVIAPDLPGFGFTEVPEERHYSYTFDSLAKTVLAFTEALNLTRYALYVFDYGAPTGFRVAVARPERITAIISQNGNAYEEGLGDAWAPIQRYWRQPTAENREILRQALDPAGLRSQYTDGVPQPERIAPEGYTLDAALLARPGNMEIQLDLFLDYANNVKRYPAFQEYFRKWKPPTLAIWGKYDPFFIPPGAEAFARDNPNARVQFLETGHFALETHVEQIAAEMREFLAKVLRDTRPAESKTAEPVGNGMVTLASPRSVEETLARLGEIVRSKGIQIFAVVDHSGEAERVGLKMPPTKLVIFGNPKAGTPLMLASPSVAIDLPLKILIWEDANGKVWLSYNAPAHLQVRHALPQDLMQNLAALELVAANTVE